MTGLIYFFTKYAPIIYLALGVGLFFAIRGLLRSLRERKTAIFGLEQELAHNHLRTAVGAVVVVILFAFVELVIQAFIGPVLPASTAIATPTLDILAIPTMTLSSSGGTEIASPQPSVTTGCIPGQVNIDSPAAGETIFGDVIVTGTADIPNFGFYKYEFSIVGDENWATILAGRAAVLDGELGHWDTTQLATGDYLLRLVVTDNQGNALPACVVPVRISGG